MISAPVLKGGKRLLIFLLPFFLMLSSPGVALAASEINLKNSGSAVPVISTPAPTKPAPAPDTTLTPPPDITVLPTADPAITPAPVTSDSTITPVETTPPTDKSIITITPATESAATSTQPGTEQSFDPKRNSGQSDIKVQPDNQTGAATLSYPFTIPQGRISLTPSLSLNYNSQNEDNSSLFGFGWNVSVPSISRIARKGVDKLYTQNFYESSLSGEIKPINLSDDSHGTYGAENDFGDFLSYEFNAANQWIVKDKNGNTYTFGKDASSRQDNPLDSTQIFKWILTEIRDSNNNFVRYEYTKDSGQVYPSRIIYTGNDSTDGIYEIAFLNEDRPDKSKSFSTHFEVNTNKRVNEIDVKVNGQTIRKYTLAYASGNNKFRSVLSGITESGLDDSGNWQTFPATTFEYTGGPAGWEKDLNYTIPEYFYSTSNNDYAGVRPMDVNGDGYIDIIKSAIVSGGSQLNKVYLNKKDGTGWALEPTIQVPINFYEENSNLFRGVKSADVNGDGLEDILKHAADGGGITEKMYINQGGLDGWAENADYDIGLLFCSGCSREEGVRIFDINGDGLTDLLMSKYTTSGESKSVYMNKGDGTGWAQDMDYYIPVIFYQWQNDEPNYTGVEIFDANADGLTDLVQNTNSGPTLKYVYLNKGDGTGWSDDPAYSIPVWFYDRSENGYRSVRLSDISGDGITDILQSYGSNAGVYIGNGKGWIKDSAYTIPASFCYPGCENYPWGTFLFDVNGDGMTDVVESNFSGGVGNQNVYINKGQKPDLLSSIHSSRGADTTITYKPTTAYKVGSTLENSRLPTVLYTVSSITTDDGLGATAATSYQYEGGEYYYNNPYDRKFAGFSKVTKTDPLGFMTVQYFHQGNGTASQLGEYLDNKAKINIVYREEIYDNSGNLFQKTINKWEKSDLGNDRSFVYNGQSLSGTGRYRAQTSTYDQTNGNLLQQKNWGEVNGNDDGTFSDTGSDIFTSAYTYSTNGMVNLPSQELITDQNGNKVSETKYYYDNLAFGAVTKGNPTKQENWISGSGYATGTKSYNSFGLVTQERDPNNNPTTYSYDSYNLYPATVTNALNQITRYEYDYSSGNVKKVTDINGYISQITYDAFDRVKEEKQPDLSTPATLVTKTIYAYNDANFPYSVQQTDYLDAATAIDTYTYFDGFERPVQERREAENGNYMIKDYLYNELGLIQKSSLPYFSSGISRTTATTNPKLYTSYAYDPLARPVSITDATGTTTNNYNQWTLTTTDSLGNKKDFEKDSYDRLVRVVEYNGAENYTTNYQYNYLGNLTQITDALGNIRRLTYDGLGRRLSAEDLHAPNDAAYGIWNYLYDNSGNLTKSTDARGIIINYAYDALNRTLTEDATNTASYVEFTYVYDNCAGGIGQLCSATGGDGPIIVSYTYYPLGLIKTENKKIVTLANQITTFSYDRQRNPVSLIYPDNTAVNYQYNSAGLPESVSAKRAGVGNFVPVISGLDYAPTGQIAGIVYANGAETNNTYDADALYRLKQKLTTKSGKNLQKLNYTFDAVGNITQIVDSSDTVSVGGANASLAKTSNFQYDNLYRLTNAVITNAASGGNYTQTYRYDAIGNILNKSDLGDYQYLGTQSGNYANPHAVTKVGATAYQYDKNGNMQYDGPTTHMWNQRNQITNDSIPIPPKYNRVLMQYKYDQDGNRVYKLNRTTTKTTYYVNKYYDIESTDIKRHIYAGNEKVATLSGPATSPLIAFHHTDHLSGSSVDTEAGGNVIEITDYQPYGATRFDKRLINYNNDYKFTGKELDEETNLYYYGARYYNAAIGRFVSQDPAGRDLTDQSLLLNPQALNMYSYVMNNPLKYVDSTGKNAELALFAPLFLIPVIGEFAIGAAAIGFGVYASVKLWQMADEAKTKISQTGQGQAGTKGDQNAKEKSQTGARDIIKQIAGGSSTGNPGGREPSDDNKNKKSNIYDNYKNRPTDEIQKGIKSLEKNIETHQNKIQNPSKYMEDFAQRSSRYQEGLLNKWQNEVTNYRNQIQTLEKIIFERSMKL